MVTGSTLPKNEWSNKHQNINIDFNSFDTKCIALIGAVSADKGMELHSQFKKSVNAQRFRIFI